VLSLSLSPLWLTSARRVHGLASRRIDTLHELIDAAYGDEVKVVQHGSRRFVLVTRVLARTTWDRATTRFPFLARIKEPHRRMPASTKLLAPPKDAAETETDTGSTDFDTAEKHSVENGCDAGPDKKPDA